MPTEPASDHPGGGKKRVHRWDLDIARLAADQHGIVAHWQLIALGLTPRAIERRVACGRLHRVHRGVFAVGHTALSRLGWWMAAALSGGPGSVLSHRPAGAAWQLRDWSGRHAITTPTWRRSRDGIDAHCAVLPPDERTVCEGIPITSVSRTILDLASILQPHQLVNVINEAEKKRHPDPLSLPLLLERHRGERGTARLRAALADIGYGVTKEALEELFALFVSARRLPRPELNAWVRAGDVSYSPDCLWREQRLIVELHSARHHGTAPAVARDATRDRRLLLAGWRVIHVTWAQLHSPAEADELERDLWTALSDAG